eukprot:CAMPEP_0195252580 /NCGR_PEP_ID=MMETSP0706-20130129/3944_1 /TAXON_ID=33640 /ORGANISM="Asterionellopsis glacialis, Strain CCMP134" /LENGTH=136 /DNA_ID=CAMNT_0040304897 /DNA_START=30 /DNA_END=440 /DNA_ORIENTATION=+
MPRVKAPMDPERQLMIKTKACQRLAKEAAYYKQEVHTNTEKLTKMKEDNQDPYDIKKFEEVLQESIMMVPDSQARLHQYVEDLSLFMETHADELAVEGEFYKAAQLLQQEHLSPDDKKDGENLTTNVDDLQDDEAF